MVGVLKTASGQASRIAAQRQSRRPPRDSLGPLLWSGTTCHASPLWALGRFSALVLEERRRGLLTRCVSLVLVLEICLTSGSNEAGLGR